ncbi:hypothetical protein ETAA8_06680 [Anatilimnocola aggregata]|uniref:Uncharacterized protein n=1 Tax=Anatilimnocola aggregata TaxID=2528021 RepID=A0A517Y5T3_9BACT|nr:hypothetical protein [Anatilimnocola aggregata]QDU25598.1 hypothetical protein ETAA8_06680 [Anatilimnocola aggregata]
MLPKNRIRSTASRKKPQPLAELADHRTLHLLDRDIWRDGNERLILLTTGLLIRAGTFNSFKDRIELQMISRIERADGTVPAGLKFPLRIMEIRPCQVAAVAMLPSVADVAKFAASFKPRHGEATHGVLK